MSHRIGCRGSITGADLRAARKAARLSQVEMARRAGISRHAVSYWEGRAQVSLCGWAVERIAAVLTLPIHLKPDARAGGWGERQLAAERLARAARETALLAAWRDSEARRASRARVVCGARTRKGTACRMQSEPGRARCKFHGGKSTGARTPEGRARIAEAQRRRWARWRAARGAPD